MEISYLVVNTPDNEYHYQDFLFWGEPENLPNKVQEIHPDWTSMIITIVRKAK